MAREIFNETNRISPWEKFKRRRKAPFTFSSNTGAGGSVRTRLCSHEYCTPAPPCIFHEPAEDLQPAKRRIFAGGIMLTIVLFLLTRRNSSIHQVPRVTTVSWKICPRGAGWNRLFNSTSTLSPLTVISTSRRAVARRWAHRAKLSDEIIAVQTPGSREPRIGRDPE